MKLLLLLVLLFSTAPRTCAQNRVWNYVRTHKVLLAADTLVVAARMADAAATVHCQKVNPRCTEGGFPIRQIFGPRPSAPAVYSMNTLNAIGLVATAHLFYHYQDAKPDVGGTQYAFVLWVGPATFLSGVAAQDAVNVANESPMARARQRLMQK